MGLAGGPTSWNRVLHREGEALASCGFAIVYGAVVVLVNAVEICRNSVIRNGQRIRETHDRVPFKDLTLSSVRGLSKPSLLREHLNLPFGLQLRME
jgi:hypothetical protein